MNWYCTEEDLVDWPEELKGYIDTSPICLKNDQLSQIAKLLIDL